MKKIFSVVLSASMLASSLLALNVANAEEGDKKMYAYDPEMQQIVISIDKGAGYEWVEVDELHGQVFHVYPKEGATTSTCVQHSFASLSKPIENTKFVVSYKLKVDYSEGADQLTTFVHADGGYFWRGGISGASNWLMDDWRNTGKSTYPDNGEWVQVDIVADQKEKTVVLYKNGAEYLRSTNTDEFVNNQKLEYVESFLSATYAYADENGLTSEVMLDSYKVFDAENGDFYVAGGRTYEDAIYIDLSATLASKNIDLAGTVLRKVGTDDTVEVSASVADYQTIKVDLAGAELEESTEYEVVLPESTVIRDMFGRKLTGGAAFYVEGSNTENVPVGSTGFDNAEGDIWKWGYWGNINAYDNAPGWVSGNWSDWGETRSAGIYNDGGNMVMLMRDFSNGQTAASGLLYDLSAIPAVCDLKISYRMKTNLNDGAYVAATFSNNRYEVGDIKESFLVSARLEGDGHQGGMSISTGSRWFMDGGYNLISKEEYQDGVWYTIESVHHLNGVGTMTADYVIKDADGNVIASVEGKTAASALVKPTLFGWRFQHGANNSDTDVMIDDLSISYDVPSNNVKSVRLVDVDGSEFVPTTTPASDMKAINVTFAAPADPADLSATLTAQDGSEIALTQTGSETSYSFALESFPKGGKEYTFSLAYGTKTYEYTFVPVAAEAVEIKDFNLYKGGEVLESLEGVTAGDEITVSATLINATGVDKEAVVSYALYGDNYLKAVNLSAGDVTDLTEGVTLYKTFTITEDLGEVDMIKGFLWDSLKTMKPLAGAIEVE